MIYINISISISFFLKSNLINALVLGQKLLPKPVRSCDPPLSLAPRNHHVLTDDDVADVKDEDNGDDVEDEEEEAVLLWVTLEGCTV